MGIQQFNAAIAKSQGQDLNAAIAECGYTRGISHRGRVVLTGADIIVTEYDAVMWTHTATREFATVEEAEAYVQGKRPEEAATLRRIAGTLKVDAERAALDGGY